MKGARSLAWVIVWIIGAAALVSICHGGIQRLNDSHATAPVSHR